MTTALLMFVGFVGVTLIITYWAARRSSGANAFFAAGRQITAWQNGLAVAGDYMSAASFPICRRYFNNYLLGRSTFLRRQRFFCGWPTDYRLAKRFRCCWRLHERRIFSDL